MYATKPDSDSEAAPEASAVSKVHPGASSEPPAKEAAPASHRSLASAIFLVGQPLFLNALSIPATAYIIRMLGDYAYGEWAVASSLVYALTCLASMGLRSLFIRSISQHPENARTALGEQLGLRGLLSLFAGALAVLIAVALRYSPVVVGCVAIASFSLVLSVLASTMGDVLQGFQRFKAFAVVNLIAGVLLTAGSVLAVVMDYGSLGLAASYAIGPFISCGMFYGLIRRDLFKPVLRVDFPRFKALLTDARMVAGQQVLTSIQSKAEQLFVPKLVGIAEMGHFSAGLMIASRLEMVPDGTATAFFPLIAKNSREDPAEASRQVSYLMTVSLVICIPLALLAMYIAPPLASFFFKKNPAVSLQVMWITVWSLPLQAILLPMYFSMQACGRHTEAARVGMWATVCNTGMSLGLIWRFGLVGACVSWLARQGITILFQMPGFMRAFPAVLPGIPLPKILAAGGLMAGVLWYSRYVPALEWVRLGAGSGIALLVYFGALMLLKVVGTSEIRQLMRRG